MDQLLKKDKLYNPIIAFQYLLHAHLQLSVKANLPWGKKGEFKHQGPHVP